MARFHCSCRIIWFPFDTRVSQSEIDQSNLSPVPHSQFAICKSIDLPSATTSPDSKTGQAEY
ncbi:hypothetical protein PISMIDRAFT_690789 [Pisolithus microcarpus 441]|uniref:Uncharacterized protein n=1 Tax=Pisolithus microcarpus 441 TaxID=765257 RepID=A0A0C9YK35_9AGAM|nr:hypothetical protein PISMIDRAFT_690789 [Pisolithus microcarpus 441]